jgi:arabinogalactan oligomer/maltooligosaccharide transport system permease protein
VGLGHLLLSGARKSEERFRREQEGFVAVNALADVVERAGGAGETVRSAAAAWQKSHPDLRSIRVVAFDGISLEASTAPEDAGEKAAPRRLTREEKPIYDQGQRLRAAVETNRQEQTARKNEIEVEKGESGALRFAAPIERADAVTGLVQIEAAPPEKTPPPRIVTALLFLAIPLALYLVGALLLGERRAALAVLSIALLSGSLLLFARTTLSALGQGRRATETAVGARIVREAEAARETLGSLDLPADGLTPAAWDSDAHRRPRGVLSAGGSPEEARLDAELGEGRRRGRNLFFGIGLAALLLAAFFGFGAAARLGTTLVRHRVGYAYVLPAMLGMVVLVFFPFLYGITLSFTNQTIYNTGAPLSEIWVGLQNYASILGDFAMARRGGDGLVFNYLNFYWTFFFTVVWTISNVAIGVSLGLVLALILNTTGLKLRPVYRVLLILPWAVPNYITALIWKGMFHRQFGVINQAIQMFGGEAISWFDRPFTSFLTALSTNGWLSFPFMMVVSLGALQSIPAEVYEAARVEGATRWQQFRSVTLPFLKPALIPAIILSVIWTFNMFNIIYLVTQGEPAGSTEILITQAYKFAFERYRYGYAAAYSTVIFLILLAYGTIQNRVTKATEAI